MTDVYTAFGENATPPVVAIVNRATVPLGVDIMELIPALQEYVDCYIAPAWGTPAVIVSGPAGGVWSIILVDNADEANSLGYHDLTRGGLPVSRVFVKESIKAGEPLSITISHELAEMLVDPVGQMWAQDIGSHTMYAYEICDAVEETHFIVRGLPVSNFVYPSFFESFRIHGKFDQMNIVGSPFLTLKGGYQVIHRNGRTKEIFASDDKRKRFAEEDRRLHRSEFRKASMAMAFLKGDNTDANR